MKKAIMPMSDYKNACDQIREITGETQAITSDKLVPEIKKVQQAAEAAGETKGYASGYSKGKTDGRAEVVEESNQTTATENTVLEGETFFKDGEIKTGNIKKAVGGITAAADVYETTVNEKPAIAVQYTPVEPTYIAPALGGITLKAELDKFGDAEEQDVTKGKTFTSKDGFKKVGTKEAEAGGSSDTYGVEVEEMLTAIPWMTRLAFNEDDALNCGGEIAFGLGIWQEVNLIIPPWIKEIDECYTDNFKDPMVAIFTSKTPPIMGWQGMWSNNGGYVPPQIIFVPDESIEAYKTATNFAEFADIMKPLSEYNGEGYYGGTM